MNWISWFLIIRIGKVLICDQFIVVVVEYIDQEEELLIMMGWQLFDLVLEVGQVHDYLVNDLLLRHFFVIKLWFCSVMLFLFWYHSFKMQIQLQIQFILNTLIFGTHWLRLKTMWGTFIDVFSLQFSFECGLLLIFYLSIL